MGPEESPSGPALPQLRPSQGCVRPLAQTGELKFGGLEAHMQLLGFVMSVCISYIPSVTVSGLPLFSWCVMDGLSERAPWSCAVDIKRFQATLYWLLYSPPPHIFMAKPKQYTPWYVSGPVMGLSAARWVCNK